MRTRPLSTWMTMYRDSRFGKIQNSRFKIKDSRTPNKLEFDSESEPARLRQVGCARRKTVTQLECQPVLRSSRKVTSCIMITAPQLNSTQLYSTSNSTSNSTSSPLTQPLTCSPTHPPSQYQSHRSSFELRAPHSPALPRPRSPVICNL